MGKKSSGVSRPQTRPREENTRWFTFVTTCPQTHPWKAPSPRADAAPGSRGTRPQAPRSRRPRINIGSLRRVSTSNNKDLHHVFWDDTARRGQCLPFCKWWFTQKQPLWDFCHGSQSIKDSATTVTALHKALLSSQNRTCIFFPCRNYYLFSITIF